MGKKEVFLQAINEKKIVTVKVDSKEKGVITRRCIPFDFGPSNKFSGNWDRYHFYDLNSPEGRHVLSIAPDQLLEIEITAESFEPRDYVKWTPNWHIKRDWGQYS